MVTLGILSPVTLAMMVPEDTIKVPEDLENFESKDFVHFTVLCNVHIGQGWNPETIEANAKIIAQIPEADFLGDGDGDGGLSFGDLERKGVILEGSEHWD